MDKEIIISYWTKINQVFTDAYLRDLIKQLLVKKVGILLLEESFSVFPLSASVLKMVA
jgi:hypothetical protein